MAMARWFPWCNRSGMEVPPSDNLLYKVVSTEYSATNSSATKVTSGSPSKGSSVHPGGGTVGDAICFNMRALIALVIKPWRAIRKPCTVWWTGPPYQVKSLAHVSGSLSSGW